jgi:hypothetical protein
MPQSRMLHKDLIQEEVSDLTVEVSDEAEHPRRSKRCGECRWGGAASDEQPRTDPRFPEGPILCLRLGKAMYSRVSFTVRGHQLGGVMLWPIRRSANPGERKLAHSAAAREGARSVAARERGIFTSAGRWKITMWNAGRVKARESVISATAKEQWEPPDPSQQLKPRSCRLIS